MIKVNSSPLGRMTPAERSMGRYMRAPDHDSGTGGDNQGGNTGAEENDSGGADNPGSGFNAEAFWNVPAAETPGTPAKGSAESGTPAAGTTPAAPVNEGQRLGQELSTRMEALNFGDAFTPEVMEQIANGDAKGINAALQAQQRNAVRESITLAATLMQAHGQSLMAKFEQMIEAKLGGRDDSDTITKEFPAAKDPAVRPMIQGVFNQAMKHTGNDRVKAVAMAKDMLKYMGKTAAPDMGIDIAPMNPGDVMSDNSKDLVAELLAR